MPVHVNQRMEVGQCDPSQGGDDAVTCEAKSVGL